MSLGFAKSRAHQCFGHYNGTIEPAPGTKISIEHLRGWAEHVHMRW